jgi:hypothetical protein
MYKGWEISFSMLCKLLIMMYPCHLLYQVSAIALCILLDEMRIEIIEGQCILSGMAHAHQSDTARHNFNFHLISHVCRDNVGAQTGLINSDKKSNSL